MITLFYPAVLGAIFYSYLPFFREYRSIADNLIAFSIALALLFHFCVDYIYTYTVVRYTLIAFVSDILILFFLYLAFDATDYLGSNSNCSFVALYLSIIYCLFIAWDISLRSKEEYFVKLLVFEALTSIFFFLAWILELPTTVLPMAIFVAGALLLYFTLKFYASIWQTAK
jgi:hypothetical protein